jgi:hypothetical protein
LKPSLDEQDVALVCVGIGSPESACEFAERAEFPVDCLYVDPTRKAYKALGLYGDLDGTEGLFFDPKVVEGVRRLFLDKSTGEGLKKRGTDGLKAATKNFKPLPPPEPRDAVQQGGLYVFRGREVLYAHKDQGTGDHAEPDEILAAAACACA